MSLILDALRKADAERQQGTVPDLHAQPLNLPAPAVVPTASPLRRAGVMAVLAAVGAVVAAWALWPRSANPPSVVPPAMAPVAQAGAGPAVAPAAPVVTTAAPAQPLVSSAPLSAPSPAVAAAPTVPPAPVTAPPVTPTAPPAKPVPAPAVAAPIPPVAKAVPPAAAPAREAREASAAPLPRLEALPPELRAQVPAMTVGGSVHSPVPASRMLILNGQVLREGDSPAPGVKLETIGRKAAVFSVGGQRFELPL